MTHLSAVGHPRTATGLRPAGLDPIEFQSGFFQATGGVVFSF